MKKVYLFFMLLLVPLVLMAQSADSTGVFTLEVDPNIQHGTLTLRPNGEAEVGQRVHVIAQPEQNYHMVSARYYQKSNATLTMPVDNNQFLMPAYNIVVTALFGSDGPSINEDLVAPSPICDGEALALTEPSYSNATSKGWEVMPSATAQIGIIPYTGQALDVSYNNWKLRFWVSDSLNTVYSNLVSITVNPLPTVSIEGESNPCSMMETEYLVPKESHVSYTWTTSDEAATVTVDNNKAKVIWGTPGRQSVTVVAENSATGCTNTAQMQVAVQSYVNDLNAIVAKVHEGKEYILIYPNPADVYKYQWYKDGQKIAGATGQYYYQSGGLDNGEYKVYVSNNSDAQGNLFCGAFTETHTVNNGRGVFSISPNPASPNQGLVVTNDSSLETSLSVYSIDGKLLHRQQLGHGITTISLNLPQGIYFCLFNEGNTTSSIQKLVIQ